jgi:hypothetical protein
MAGPGAPPWRRRSSMCGDIRAAGIVHEVASEDQVLARSVQLAAGLAEHKRMLYGAAIKTCGA